MKVATWCARALPFAGRGPPLRAVEHAVSPAVLLEAERQLATQHFSNELHFANDTVLIVTPSVVEKKDEKKDEDLASELSRFTLPLLLVWLSSPLLSLADSTFVGAMRSTTELAALGPACALCDNAYFAATFVSVVTTSAVARAAARGDEAEAKAVAAGAVASAAVIGLALTIALSFTPLGAMAIAALVGSPAPALEREAVAYVAVRALGFVPALVSSGLQATSLARRDVSSPVHAAGVAGVVNLLGDALLVPTAGVVGAALATVLAQVAACIVVVRSALVKGYVELRRGAERTLKAARRVFTDGAPVLATLVAKCAVLSALAYSATASAAARGELGEIAAHQILVGLYFVFAPVGDALSQTVMTFLPKAVQEDNSGRAVIHGALKASLLLGVLDAVLAYAAPVLFPHVFTRDLAVVTALHATAPLLALALLLHAACASLEGTLLAVNDTKVLSAFYAVDAFVAVAAFVALATSAASLHTVWACFFAYQITRSSQFAFRVLTTVLQRPPKEPPETRPRWIVRVRRRRRVPAVA